MERVGDIDETQTSHAVSLNKSGISAAEARCHLFMVNEKNFKSDLRRRGVNQQPGVKECVVWLKQNIVKDRKTVKCVCDAGVDTAVLKQMTDQMQPNRNI